MSTRPNVKLDLYVTTPIIIEVFLHWKMALSLLFRYLVTGFELHIYKICYKSSKTGKIKP